MPDAASNIGGIWFDLRAPTGAFEQDMNRAKMASQRTARDISYTLATGLAMGVAKAAIAVRGLTSTIDILSVAISLFRGRYEDAATTIRSLPFVASLEKTISGFADALTGPSDATLKRIAEFTERIAARQKGMASVAESIEKMALLGTKATPMGEALALRNEANVKAANEMPNDPFGQWQVKRRIQAAYEEAKVRITLREDAEAFANREKQWAKEREEEARERLKVEDALYEAKMKHIRDEIAERAEAARFAEEEQRNAEERERTRKAAFESANTWLRERQSLEGRARAAELRMGGNEVGARRAEIEAEYGGSGGLIRQTQRRGLTAEAELYRRIAYAEWEMAGQGAAAGGAAAKFMQREAGRFSAGIGGAGDPLLNVNTEQLKVQREMLKQLQNPRPARAA